MDIKLVGGNRLLPTSRCKSGRIINITVNGVPTEAVVNRTEKYTYFQVDGHDLSVTGVLEDGSVHTTEEYIPKVKAPVELDADGNPVKKVRAKAAPKLDENGEPVAKAERTRKPKAEVVEEEAEAA
jgi:hypothetical protein